MHDHAPARRVQDHGCSALLTTRGPGEANRVRLDGCLDLVGIETFEDNGFVADALCLSHWS